MLVVTQLVVSRTYCTSPFDCIYGTGMASHPCAFVCALQFGQVEEALRAELALEGSELNMDSQVPPQLIP